MLNKKRVLITGGTGSFGKKFIETILVKYPDVKNIIIFSRDELKQSELRQKYNQKDYPQLRFFIGDVRDRDRLIQASENVDVIIHAAAIKQVDTAEYNPTECIRTNLDGAENVIQAALQCGVKDVVALSTDKACAPINLYGATKLASDKLFTAANNKIPSYKILDVASAIAPECKLKTVGIRPGEKLHEEMITDTDSLNTIDLGKYYAILPSVSFTYSEDEYMAHHKATKVPFGFKYNSGTNTEWESVESLRKLIVEHVDSNFS